MRSAAQEYRTIATGAGWIDRGTRGRLRFDGPDAITFLQALLSNDVGALTPGRGLYATYLTQQGRMIADIAIYHRGGWLIGEVAPGMAATLASRLDGLLFSEDVRITDVSAAFSETVVVGRAAAAIVAEALAVDASALEALGELSQIECASGFVVRSGDARLPMFTIIAESDRESIQSRLGEVGAVRISERLADALRIDAGRPAFGVDMNEDTIPLEAGLLERAISTTKGCYVGQEVVIRILHRGGGRVAKRLVTFSSDPTTVAAPAPGAALFSDGRDVGRVTSAAPALERDGFIGLGYVVRDAAETGSRLFVGAADGSPASITGFAG